MSHVEAQYAGLVSLLQAGCVKHIAGIRIVDDTNAWVAPQQQATIEAAFHPEDLVDDGSDPHLCQAKKTSSNSGKQGKRKVCHPPSLPKVPCELSWSLSFNVWNF